MKKILLTTFLIAIALGQGCQKYENVGVDLEIVNSRDAVTDLADDIANDPIFKRLGDSYYNFIRLIATDDAISNSITADQFFEDFEESNCPSVSSLDSLLTEYDFAEKSSILALASQIISKSDSIYSIYYSSIIALSAVQFRAAKILAWQDYYDDIDAQQGGDCCKDYKWALAKCCGVPAIWVVGAWTGFLAAGGVAIMPSPYDILQDAYACINAAKAKYGGCCPE